MREKAKIIAGSVAVITIVAAVVYAFLFIPQRPIFELGEWEIVPGKSVMIGFTCTVNELVEIRLLNPTGEMVGRTYLPTGATEGEISMAPTWDTPMGGNYKMMAGYPRSPFESIVKYTFSFSGPDVSIEEVSLDWEYDEFAQKDLLESVSVELVNSGDLPAQVVAFPGNIGAVFGGPLREWCTPGRQTVKWGISQVGEVIDSPAVWWPSLTDGATLIIIVEGYEGEVLAKREILIDVPD